MKLERSNAEENERFWLAAPVCETFVVDVVLKKLQEQHIFFGGKDKAL